METALLLTTVTVTKMEVDALAMVLAPAFLAAGNREVPVPCQMRVLVCVRCTFAGRLRGAQGFRRLQYLGEIPSRYLVALPSLKIPSI